MTAQRPSVLVYQEESTQTIVETTPTLNSLIAGPAYHIQDYPADRASTLLAAYGTLTGDSDATLLMGVVGIPATNSDAIIAGDAPNNVLGALLDSASFTAYLENAVAIVVTGDAGVFSTTAPDENLFTDAGATFVTDGVVPGDRFVSTDPAGPYTVLKTVLSVVSETELRTQSNYTTAGTDINGVAYTGAATTGLNWRVERSLADGTEVPSAYVELDGNEITVLGGVQILVDFDADGTPEAHTLSYGDVYAEYRSLRQDLAVLKEINEANLVSVLGPVDERNPLAAGVRTALNNSGGNTIQAWGITGDDLNGTSDIVTAYGEMLLQLESRRDIYAITPMTTDPTVLNNVTAHCVEYSTPERARFRKMIGGWGPLVTVKTIGTSSITATTEQVAADDISVLSVVSGTFDTANVSSGDTLAIVEDSFGTTRVGTYALEGRYDETRLQSAALSTTTAGTGDIKYWIFKGSTGTTLRTVATTLTDTESTFSVPAGTGTDDDVGRVVRLIGPAAGNTNGSALGNDDYLIVSRATDVYTVLGTWGATESIDVSIIDVRTSSVAAVEAVNRKAFRQILDPNATFITNGAVVSDIVEVPTPAVAEGTDFDSVYSAAVSAVSSETRLVLATGTDLPTVAPGATAQTDMGYRVRRSLDRAGQRDDLIAVVNGTGSYENKKMTLVPPTESLLSSIVNGKTGVQSRQPSYYLACATAGLNAGQPPHQGFTNLPINGIDEIFYSSRYFSEDDIESISNAGWYMYIQPTVSAAPFCMHQLTTDTSSVLNQELSMVRNYDYVSLFFYDILKKFIGRYNVTTGTLELLRESLQNGIEQLRSNPLPRIGASLNDGTIDSLAILGGTIDRVEVYMDLDMPAPLNQVGLHLIA